MIDRIRAGNYGVGADNVLRGPGGLRVDLNACPSDWSDHEGLGRGTFTIGYTSAQSGYLQAYGQVGEGMSSYFDYVNSTGGIQGQRIELQMRDDGYVADRTIDEVESWLASRTQPFAITTLGTPNGLAVQRMLNDACVPHPFALSAHQALTNPAEYPFTNGLQMSHATEARIWGEWIRRNMADQLPVKVGALIMDNDFGLTYERAFSTWVRDNPDVVSDFHRVRHNPAAPTVTPEMNTIIAGEPDVFISMTTGSPCLLAVQEAGHKGLTASAVAFTPSVCRSEASYMAPAGEVADGFLSAQGGILGPNDPGVDEQFARFVNSTLRADGLNINDLTEQGFGLHGWTYVEALRIAAELEGGMSRTNLLLAMWSLDLHHPLADDGARLRTNGPSDSFAIEGSRIDRWDAASQQWKPATGVIDINGKTPSCTWVTGVGC